MNPFVKVEFDSTKNMEELLEGKYEVNSFSVIAYS